MDKGSLRAVLDELGRRAGIRTKLNPHAFRHARATELAKYLTESQLRAIMGWTPGSSMPGIYVHLSGRDADRAILSAHGIDMSDDPKLSAPRKCPACVEINPSDAKFCLRCKQPMDTRTSQCMDEAFAKIGHVLPDIVANVKAMRDFKRLLHKHRILSDQKEPA